MKILPILTYENPILRKRAPEAVRFEDAAFQTFLDDLAHTMYEKDGVGLAAPQVGNSVRVIAVTPTPNSFEKQKDGKRDVLIMINPVISKHSWRQSNGEEACLSVPEYFGHVMRWNGVTVTYRDRTGVEQSINATGLLARVLQHEIDHLDGILFIDRADKVFELSSLQY